MEVAGSTRKPFQQTEINWDKSQVRNPLPVKARGLPSGSSSSHQACLVRVTSPMWFVSYCIEAGFYPVRTQKGSGCGFPCHQKKKKTLEKSVEWRIFRLDKTRFYVVGAGIFTGLTVALYPISVIKTRMQVATNNAANESAFSVVRGLVRNDGIPGLYRGFGTVITGAVPARIIFLTALETTKVTAFKMVEPFKLSEPVQAAIANGVAGMLASLCSQSVFVPIDIVSQRLMVQGYSGHASYNGGLDVARKVLKSEGIRGLYRGFSLSVLTYSPSSAVWWASYGSSQRFIWSKLLDNGTEHGGPAPSQGKIVSVQAAGGIIAGATASCITTPLDTIKTRLQVMGHDKRPTARQVVKQLIAEDGWTGFYRGLGPRFVSMSAWGTSMILAYEYLKRLCAVNE